MKFSQKLREENTAIFQTLFRHPFIDEIGKGKVPEKSIAHYIKADFEYLNAFINIYGMAIAKSTNRRDMNFFNNQIHFVLNGETQPHHNFCDYIGVEYDDLQGYPLPPTADHYVKHMMYHGQSGSTADIICALLPCPWTYLEIAQELMKTYQPTKEHPFYSWITFYASKRMKETTMNMCYRLDELAEEASVVDKERMKQAFHKSCEMELAFWEMAYTCEEWPMKAMVNNE